MSYRAVLWDWDGTLNPNLKIIHKLYLKLKKRGKNLSEFRQTIEPDVYRYMYAEGIHDQEQLKRTQKAYLRYLQKRGRLVNGGREILQYVNTILQVPQCITSESSRRLYISTVLERKNASDYVDAIVAIEDRRRNTNKWELGAQRLGIPLEECIAVDDMMQGIDSAKKSGAGLVYGVTHGYHTRKLIESAHPDKILSNIPMLYNELSMDLGYSAKRSQNPELIA